MDETGQHDDQRRVERDAMAAAWRDLLDRSYTECMTVSTLATWFKVNRKTMRTILDSIGAQRHGRLWRVPIRRMPAEYLLEIGVPL